MAKQIIYDEDARAKLLKGVETVAKAVRVTLGPCGKLVMFKKNGSLVAIKDGVTVAKEIELEDPYEDLGATLAKEVASKTNVESGDNTTTSTVLAYSIVKEGMKAVVAGIKPIDLKNGIEKATKDVIANLEKASKKVESEKDIINVATISANNDSEIGKTIGEVVYKIGKDGVITVEESNGVDLSVKTREGLQFDKGWKSPYFATNKERLEVDYEKAHILVTDYNITSIGDLMPILEANVKTGLPLLIICEDCEEGTDALNTLVINSIRNTLSVCVVKAPSYGDKKKEWLQDIATITGAKVISSEFGGVLKQATLNDLGTAKVKVTKDTTTITNGEGDKEAVKALINTLQSRIDSTDDDYIKNQTKARKARLTGGVAVISVGGTTDTERTEKKYRVDDTVCATRAALEKGILPGGGLALINAKSEPCNELNDGEKIGYSIVINSLSSPLKQIVENAGANGDVVLEKVLNSKEGIGYNARTGEYVNMIENGIIDTAKGIENALANAASVATVILTTDCCITDIPKEEGPTIATPIGAMPY